MSAIKLMTEFNSAKISRKRLGNLGEEIAADYLKNKGYKILDKNFFVKFKNGPKLGEIDLITQKEGKIVFFEIKTETKNKIAQPEQKVNFRKREKIKKVAEIWLDRNKKQQDIEWQIDVLSVILDFSKKKATIIHFKNI
jgi:putative endonuclease